MVIVQLLAVIHYCPGTCKGPYGAHILSWSIGATNRPYFYSHHEIEGMITEAEWELSLVGKSIVQIVPSSNILDLPGFSDTIDGAINGLIPGINRPAI